MSLMRKRRLERVYQHQTAAMSWTDPYDLSMALLEAFQAVSAGLACWMPKYERELSPDEQAALEQAIRDADRMHEQVIEERAVAARHWPGAKT
jgi:hypothetical protein